MKNLTRHLYFWVLLAILLGGTLGYVSPSTGVALKPLGDGFIALVKMLISPIIFCTVVLGIAGGTAPLIATWLILVTGNSLMPAFYLAIGALVALGAAFAMIDRSRAPLR